MILKRECPGRTSTSPCTHGIRIGRSVQSNHASVCPTLYCSAQLLCLTRDQFQSKLGDLSALRSMWRFEALRRVPLLCTLPPDLMNRLAVALVSEQFQPGQEVIAEVRSACKEQGTRAARKAKRALEAFSSSVSSCNTAMHPSCVFCRVRGERSSTSSSMAALAYSRRPAPHEPPSQPPPQLQCQAWGLPYPSQGQPAPRSTPWHTSLSRLHLAISLCR